MKIPKYLSDAVNEIDATLFSSDTFFNQPKMCDEMIEFLDRWKRRLTKIKEEYNGTL